MNRHSVRGVASAGRVLIMVLALLSTVAMPPAWAATGWFGEELPEDLIKSAAHGVYVHQPCHTVTSHTVTSHTVISTMVYVPAGAFVRGTSQARVRQLQAQFGDYFTGESPQRSVYLNAYYIDRTEVTNRQYAQFLHAIGTAGHQYRHADEPPDKKHTPTYWRDPRLNGPTHPVTGVDWYDAYAYCHWAGKWLPTEAQWEKAARGAHGQAYPWGDEWVASYSRNLESTFGDPVLSEKHWLHVLGHLNLNALQTLTQPVASFPPGVSPYGAHDMAGNLWEWCQDSYHQAAYRSASTRNPMGPPPSPYKVLRGGAWSSHRGKVRAAYRNYDLLTDRHLEIGFRCVR